MSMLRTIHGTNSTKSRQSSCMKRTFASALFLVCVCFAQVDIPSTPAGKVFAAWLEAINSGDKAKLQSFQKFYATDKPDFAERTLDLRERSGGFDLVSINQSEALRIGG